MSAALKYDWYSLEEYLAAEELSEERHEFVAGHVYAMAGGTNAHGFIGANILGAFVAALKGKPCRPSGSDVKIKVNVANRDCVFYPDVSVVCDSNPLEMSYQERPVVVVEVLSSSTRQRDLHTKVIAYSALPSLRAYLIVEQNPVSVTVHRRTADGFAIEHYTRLSDIIPLPEIDAQLPLADVYEGVVLAE